MVLHVSEAVPRQRCFRLFCWLAFFFVKNMTIGEGPLGKILGGRLKVSFGLEGLDWIRCCCLFVFCFLKMW